MRFTNIVDPTPIVADPFARYAAAKLALAAAEQEVADAKAEVIAELDRIGQRSTTYVGADGKVRQFTKAAQTRTSVDDAGLRAALGTREWNKLAPRVFNKKLLEEALETGKVDPSVVAPFVTATTGAPYITYTESDAE